MVKVVAKHCTKFNMQQVCENVCSFSLEKLHTLTPVPLCLSHVDGSVNSTTKSNLLNYIDSQFVTVPPSSSDATMIDAAFLCTCK